MIKTVIKPTQALFASLVLGLSIATPALAKDFVSSSKATDMIELYTSEGCSSCPRADHWLSTFKSGAVRNKNFTNNPVLFRDVIPMAFHVDYWDYIGWKDRFASPVYSERQRQHVRQGNSNQSYTPQFITNSNEWRAWFSGTRDWQANDKTVGVLKVSVPDNSQQLFVRFNPQNNVGSTAAKPTQYVLNVAVLGMGLQSRVTAGENVDTTLHHDFVVLKHEKQTVAANPSQWRLNMPAIPQSGQTQSALVVWLSEPNTQRTIQATGGYL